MPRKGESLSPEHKAKLRAAHAAAQARKAAANTAVAERPVAASNDPLRDLAALIVQAASKDAEEEKILDQFTGLLERIDFKKHPELRDHPAMQGLIERAFDRDPNESKPSPGRIAPGSVTGGTGWQERTEPWTWQHLHFLEQEEIKRGDPHPMFVKTSFTPERTQQVIWNGLSVWFAAGVTSTYHKVFVDMYMSQIRNTREADRHAQWLFKKGPWDSRIPIELQPAPEPDWLQDENAFNLRAQGEGMYQPGMGWNPAVDGRRFIPGFGPAPAVEPPAPAPPEGEPANAG